MTFSPSEESNGPVGPAGDLVEQKKLVTICQTSGYVGHSVPSFNGQGETRILLYKRGKPIGHGALGSVELQELDADVKNVPRLRAVKAIEKHKVKGIDWRREVKALASTCKVRII